jgi:hypothetical protein
MTLELAAYLNLILLTRLVYLRSDGPLSTGSAVRVAVILTVLMAVVFQFGPASIAALVVAAAVIFWEPVIGQRVDMASGYRLGGLVAQAVVPAYIGSLAGAFEFSPLFVAVGSHAAAHLPFLVPANAVDLDRGMLILLGLLLLGNETNILVRAVFHHLDLEPRRVGSDELDTAEYNAGRVIGILERWLMFLVVLWSEDLSALAFIIAAKGLARFRQLEEKTFAEYMLVGTLLSALVSVILGRVIRGLFQG